MTRGESGMCLIVPVSLAGLVAMWGLAVGMLGWATFGGPPLAGEWGLLCSAAAAAWTVVHMMAKSADLIRQAFDLGVEAGLKRVR